MSLRIWLPLDGDLHNQGLTLLPDTSVNTFTYSNGKIGQCATGRVAWHLDDEILGNTWSVAMWIKPSSLGSANNILFCKNGTSASDCHIYFSIISTTQLNIGINGPSSSVIATGQTFTTGTWYHVAATYDGTIATLYLNGIELKHGTVTTACPTGRLNMNINGRSTNAANTSTTGNITCSFNDFRLYDHCLSAAEVHEISQGLVLHYKLDDLENGVLDSSGYGHNGTTLNTVSLSNDTCRYSSSISLPNGNSAINCGRGGMMTDSITVNMWLKSSSWANPVSCTESGGWNFEASGDYFRFSIYISGVGYKYGQSTHTRAQICDNQWHMLTGIYDRINQKVQIYVDGELDNDYAAGTSNNIGYNGSNVIWIGAEASSSATGIGSNGMTGLFSDFRIYCIPLSADDILALYHTGAKIDNKANFHTFEIDENDTNKLTKTGIMHDNMEESILTLPDGSCWQLLMFHYVDGGHNLFTSSKVLNCDEFGLFSRLKDINNFTYNDKYEFYVIQDDIEYRWTQTNQPTASSISGLTTVSGYTNPVNGLAKASQSNSYFGYNAWWGAVGCYTSFSTGGKTGIPGFGSHDANGICTRYMALYARIEKADVKISNQTLNASEIIEL